MVLSFSFLLFLVQIPSAPKSAHDFCQGVCFFHNFGTFVCIKDSFSYCSWSSCPWGLVASLSSSVSKRYFPFWGFFFASLRSLVNCWFFFIEFWTFSTQPSCVHYCTTQPFCTSPEWKNGSMSSCFLTETTFGLKFWHLVVFHSGFL